MKKRTLRANPVARAIAYQRWSAQGVTAQIHALTGANTRALCNLAGKMFYTMLGGCIAEGLDHEDVDVRILRGAINAVYDIADRPDMTEPERLAIASGLVAVERLAERVSKAAIVNSHFELEDRLQQGDVFMSDFHSLVQQA